MSDDRKPGYDFVVPPGSTTYRQQPAPRDRAHPGPLNGLLPRQTPWADAIGPARRSGPPRWLLIPLVLVLLFAVPGLLAAIALPVFFSQRLSGEYQATTVRLPDTFNGHKRATGTKAEALAKRFAVGDLRAEDVAVYGKVGPKAVIILAHKPPAALSDSRQAAERSDIERDFAAQGTPLFLIKEPDPGLVGGWIGCGTTGRGLQICLATSVGSLVTVISRADGGNPVTLLRQARAATVHRS